MLIFVSIDNAVLICYNYTVNTVSLSRSDRDAWRIDVYSKVYVEITNVCNMSCSFCHGHSRETRRMSADEFSRVLDALEGQTKFISGL